jgi:hypothetical protein
MRVGSKRRTKRDRTRKMVGADDAAGLRLSGSKSAASRQVGGDHYSKLAIQPFKYIIKNKLGYAEGTAIAYITRWRDKGGLKDLRKAIHTLELLIESEAR